MRYYSKLSNKLYLVRVPTIATYTDMEIELYGLPIDENSKGEQTDTYSNMSTVMLPLDTLIGIYEQGYRITVPDHDDMLEMYKELSAYLGGGEYQLTTSLNSSGFTETRLDAIDGLAASIFNNNKREVVKDSIKVNDSAFSIGFKQMTAGFGSSHNTEPVTSIMDTYKEQNPAIRNRETSFIVNTPVEVDIDKVTRTSNRKKWRSINK